MTITISGSGLTIGDISAVAYGENVSLSTDATITARLERSRQIVKTKIASGEQIYGVTTLFGAMADQYVDSSQLVELQNLALWQHKSTTGPRLPPVEVRAAMVLRANSLMKGASGIRREIIERFIVFLNADAIPHVYQRGSIGASGDLVPFSYIAGAIIGLDPAFKVDYRNEILDSHSTLKKLGLKPIALEAKEGLALNNGTGVSTGIAAVAVQRAIRLMSLTLGIHALYAQAMLSTSQTFAPFIHDIKPHAGQVWTAQEMGKLVAGSKLMRDEAAGDRGNRTGKLIQDRYSLRCLPQFIGPIADGLKVAADQIQVESNSANDNPLIDTDTGEIYHTGNFLAQYTGVAMDSVRYLIGLLAKHVDAQIALLMTPEFSYGLSASLVGNPNGGLNVGLKSLQVGGNQMMPLISFYGQSIVDRFPTHAEQFNQNINSQAMNAANLAREQLDVLEHFLAIALMCAVQAVELRSKLIADTYDARGVLSPATQALYATARSATGSPPNSERPLMWNDMDKFIQPSIEGILAGIVPGGAITEAMSGIAGRLRA